MRRSAPAGADSAEVKTYLRRQQQKVDDRLESADAACGHLSRDRPRGHALQPLRRGQAGSSGARSGDGGSPGRGRRDLVATGLRPGADSHLLPDSRRPSRHGRRRLPAGAADVPQEIRGGHRDSGRERPDDPGLPAPVGDAGSGGSGLREGFRSSVTCAAPSAPPPA